jgi:hypothetical protein
LLAEKLGLAGWCRLSFNYLMPMEDINYVLDAINSIIQTWPNYLRDYDYSEEKNLFTLKQL